MTVQFSEAVTVTAPQLTLETGATAVVDYKRQRHHHADIQLYGRRWTHLSRPGLPSSAAPGISAAALLPTRWEYCILTLAAPARPALGRYKDIAIDSILQPFRT